MKRYLLILLAIFMLSGCQRETVDTAASSEENYSQDGSSMLAGVGSESSASEDLATIHYQEDETVSVVKEAYELSCEPYTLSEEEMVALFGKYASANKETDYRYEVNIGDQGEFYIIFDIGLTEWTDENIETLSQDIEQYLMANLQLEEENTYQLTYKGTPILGNAILASPYEQEKSIIGSFLDLSFEEDTLYVYAAGLRKINNVTKTYNAGELLSEEEALAIAESQVNDFVDLGSVDEVEDVYDYQIECADMIYIPLPEKNENTEKLIPCWRFQMDVTINSQFEGEESQVELEQTIVIDAVTGMVYDF